MCVLRCIVVLPVFLVPSFSSLCFSLASTQVFPSKSLLLYLKSVDCTQLSVTIGREPPSLTWVQFVWRGCGCYTTTSYMHPLCGCLRPIKLSSECPERSPPRSRISTASQPSSPLLHPASKPLHQGEDPSPSLQPESRTASPTEPSAWG